MIDHEGPDQMGFLARLLAKACFLGMFPREIEIDTPGGRIHDRIVFGGIGGLAPSENGRTALDSMLKSFVVEG